MRIPLHPRQSHAYTSGATEILYGGAAGGGKSYYLRASAIRWALSAPGCQIYLFRKTQPELKANHLRGPSSFLELLGPSIARGLVRYSETAAEFTFANGSVVHLCHLQRDGDLHKYQGAEIHVLLMDELTHFTAHQYRFLRSRVRLGGHDLPAGLEGVLPRIECASNPGSVGHQWVKAGFVTPVPERTVWKAPADEGGMHRQYLPARIADNPTLTGNDPGYLRRLKGLATPELVRAMKDGDWDIVAGQAFEMWQRERHVIDPFPIPPAWTRFRAMDWGSSKPFSVGWWAVADGTTAGVPPGALVRYREWYGWNGKPDTGLRITSEELAEGILKRERPDESIAYSVADPAIFGSHDGPSVAERMARHGLAFKRAVNDRAAGFQEMRSRLTGMDGRPMLVVFSGCTDGFLRTVPNLVLDTHNPEDVDTTQEDHAYDEARYACMSRPWVASPSRVASRERDRWNRAFTGPATDNWRTI
ncbi:MAG: terminase family protein [Nitrospirota bacterium]|nr:terminase family protein [Nitrospirota bacterium]